MTDAVRIIRSSQGNDDKVSLAVQREETEALADELGINELVTIDLGIHTGFSAFTRPSKNNRIDQVDEYQELLDDLQAGVYDYVIAYDDTRICRDDYFFVIQFHAIAGGAEFRFCEDVDMDSIGFRVTRVVEQFVKIKEMRKAKEAMAHRADQGMDHGPAPYGLQYDDAGEYWVVDPDEIGVVKRVYELREQGMSYREIADESPLGKSAVGKVLSRREEYERFLNLPESTV